MFSIRPRIASVARNDSGSVSRRFALSSSVRSKNWTPCVWFALGSSEPTNLASDAMRSERIGFRLYAMAEEPICSRSNGSSISPNAWSMRMSALNLAALAAMPLTTPSTCASSLRE